MSNVERQNNSLFTFETDGETVAQGLVGALVITDSGRFVISEVDYFFADGNLLAISWGLVDNGRAEEIYDYIDSYSLNEIPIIVCHPRLPRAIDLFVKVVLPYYHPTKRIFAWWGPWEIMERYKLGDKEGAIRGLTALSQVITANETVPEVFNKKGRIVDGTIFKPERGVSWGAGTLIYMMNELEKMGAFK